MFHIFTDNEVPTVKCPAEVQEITSEEKVYIIFDNVVATDNLGEPTISYTISGEEIPADNLFPADGEPKEIFATAKDSFNNEASCTYTLTVKGTKLNLHSISLVV